MTSRSLRQLFRAALAAAPLAACGGGGAPVVEPPPPATAILVVTQPAGAVSGSPLTVQPVVQFRTATGAIAASFTAPVTAALVGAGGTLEGTSTVNAVGGSATFTDLRVTGAGTYAMSFSTSGLSATSTGTFNITPLIGPPASLTVAAPRMLIAVGSPVSLQPAVRDAQGNVVTGSTFTFVSRTPAIAPVTANGLVTAQALGQSIVVATLASNATIADSTLIVVVPAAGTALFSSIEGFSLKRDTTLTVSIYIGFLGSTKALSSGVVDVVVNPAQLLYQSSAPGSAVTPEVNATVAGRVRLAFAIPYGMGGRVEIARLIYKAGATAGTAGALTLVASEATASDYTDLLPSMAQVIQPLVLR